MKILLLSEGRTGSHSIMEWINKNLNLKIISETNEFDDFDYINNDDFIIKKPISNKNFNLDDVKYFNKIIVLYREDTLKQSESNVYSILKKKWHHDNLEKNNGFYELDEEFLKKNRKKIWDGKYSFDDLNKIYKKINVGIKITYEDIFIKKIGQEILENYLDFKAKEPLCDEHNKLRKENLNVTLNFLKNEIDLLKNEIDLLNKENENLKEKIKMFNYKYKRII